MRRWYSGDLLTAASGVTLAVAAGAPWVQGSGALSAGASVNENWLVFWTIVTALVLLVAGWARSPWGALVSLSGALAIAFVGFTGALPAHAQGVEAGFGLFALAAAGTLALAGGVVGAIEREGETGSGM